MHTEKLKTLTENRIYFNDKYRFETKRAQVFEIKLNAL